MCTDDAEGKAFLGTLSAGVTSTWRSQVHLDGKPFQFKLDTGAEVTAVLEETFKQVRVPGKLQKATKILYGPACQSLTVLGQFRGRLQVQNRTHQETIFVVRGLRNNPLELPALMAL